MNYVTVQGARLYTMVSSPADLGTEVYGFPIDENLQFIRDERARELCYENHRLFDLRRWRVADVMFQDGVKVHTSFCLLRWWTRINGFS